MNMFLLAQSSAPQAPNLWMSLIPLIFWGAILLVFPIMMILDLMKREMEGSKRICWLLIILFTNLIGATLYFFNVKRKDL
jgi:hypothetical protein